MRRLISLMVVMAVMAAMMVANVAPAFAAPAWKDGVKETTTDTETLNCTWGWGSGKSGKLPCYSTS